MNSPRRIANRVFLGALALLLAVALLLLAFPAAVLNTATLTYAMRRFGRDYRLSASELSLRVTSPGLFTKRVALRARDFCFDEFHGAAKGCLPVLEVEAVVRLGAGPLLSVRRLERLVLHAGELRFDSTAAPVAPEKRARAERPLELAPAWAARMTLGAVDVRVPKAVLVSTTGAATAGLIAGFLSTSTAPLRAEAYAVLKGTGPEPGTRWEADLTLDSDLFREGRLTSLDASARARSDGGLSAAAVAKLEPRDGGVRGAFDAFVASARGRMSLAALEGCRIEARRSRRSGRFERPDVDCRITLQPAPFGRGQGPKPKALTGTASLHGEKASVRLGPGAGYGGFVVSLDAELGKRTRASAKAKIESFAVLVRLLDGTEFAVPAPLNALDGTIEADARLAGGGGRPRVLELRARTDLASPKQALAVSVKGRVETRPPGKRGGLKAEAAVELERVVLQLPYLELKRGAAVEAVRAGGGAPEPSEIDYDATVRTSTPMILTTNLIKSPVPISLDLRARPEGLGGTIRVESFDTEVFRRNARIDHITLTPRPEGAAAGLDGRIVYKRGNATVNILLLGSAAKPAVVFESDPPMPQSEIVALVLYGRRADELDSDQKASAGHATAAMTSGAFGLASLYLIASTPVDSVRYDEATRSYRVNLKLPGGAALSVGSNPRESSTLALRKSLARGARSRGVISTFLRWFQRY